MEIAIIDDDLEFSKVLQRDVERFISVLFTKFNVDIINDNFFSNSVNKKYDIYFLDIDLDKVSGINIGRKLLVSETNPIIIFVSSREDLVFSSFSVRPFYFVRKSNIEEDMKIMFLLLKSI